MISQPAKGPNKFHQTVRNMFLRVGVTQPFYNRPGEFHHVGRLAIINEIGLTRRFTGFFQLSGGQ